MKLIFFRFKYLLLTTHLFLLFEARGVELEPRYESVFLNAQESIAEIGVTLLKSCPPDECLLIGLGRSPSLIVAFLEAAVESYIYQLPLSNFRYDISKKELISSTRFPALSNFYERKLWEHFDNFLPNKEQLADRKILLLDYSKGPSLFSALEYVKAYYNTRGIKVEITPMALVASRENFEQPSKSLLYPNQEKLLKFYTEDYPLFIGGRKHYLGEMFKNSQFDIFSAHGSFDIYRNDADDFGLSHKREEYKHIVGRFKKLIKKKIGLSQEIELIKKSARPDCSKIIKNILKKK